LHVEAFPVAAFAGPDFAENTLGFGNFAASLSLVLGDVSYKRGIGRERLHVEIAKRVANEFVFVRPVDLGFFVGECTESLLELAESVIDQRR